MALDLQFPNPARSDAQGIFDMERAGRLTEDMEAQRAGMVDYLDVLNYMNGNSFDDRLLTRHAIAYMGCAMPSLAFIDPHKTREMAYNLGLVVDNIESIRLRSRIDSYNSDNVTLVQRALNAAFYRLVSGRPDHDADLRELAQRIGSIVEANRAQQHIGAIDTTRGRFEVVPNVMALMVFELHDRFFGTRYCAMGDDMVNLVVQTLRDEETGLFFESYQTGSIGYPTESLNPASAWRTSVLNTWTNALDITFAHWVDPAGCERAWESFKRDMLPEVLELTADDVSSSIGCSFITQLGKAGESLLGGMLAAREMGDVETFGVLQDRLFEIGDPQLWEGHLCFAELGELQHMVEAFALFARAHIPWARLFAHPWDTYYEFDYREVR